MEKLEHSPAYNAGEDVKWFGHCPTVQFLKKLKIVTMWPSNSTPVYIMKRTENVCSDENLYKNVHGNINHNVKKQKQLKYSSTD